MCQIPKKKFAQCQGVVVQDENCQGVVQVVAWGELFFWNLIYFLIFNLKIHTSNLIFLGFKVSFFHKNFKTGLIFVVLRISKLIPKLSTYRWDTLCIYISVSSVVEI